LPTLRPDIQAALHEVIPAGLSVGNPVDNGGIAMMAGHGPRIVELCLADPAIGLLMFPITPLRNMIELMGESLVKGREMTDKPIFVIWSAPTTTHPVYQELWDAGLPVFSNYRNAITAARALLRRSRTSELAEVAALARQLPALTTGGSGRSELLDEADSTAWLRHRGFSFAPAEGAVDADEAVAAAARLGYPVVLKARGPVHRSELGLVATGLSSADDVARTAARFLAADDVTGLVVARQVSGGIELLAGVTRDPVLGPVILVGSGGVAAEALADVSRSVLPLTRTRAGEMLDRLRIAPLLRGWRGSPPVDREAIIDTLLRLAEVAVREPVAEIDINPLLARPDGVVGLDALVRLEVAAS
jgi:acyl-CoA synthetase (NDP forming)